MLKTIQGLDRNQLQIFTTKSGITISANNNGFWHFVVLNTEQAREAYRALAAAIRFFGDETTLLSDDIEGLGDQS